MEPQQKNCFKCGSVLPEKSGKRKSKCNKCIGKDYRSKIQDNPVKWLHYKLYQNDRKRKRYPEEWKTVASVQGVYDRCEGKCVETGETSYKLLCVTSIKANPEKVDDLVLLTSTKASSIRRHHL